ncbi:PhzF family phenazine biosynthesis protein [Paenibacillus sp. BR2-3]|uniref:PhzF family phenazine biosynthesis protein n=1 Tax=Paenibacillus sp. BR2-3 TaxID=3048494 RepID=UPI0039774E76
MSIPIFIVDAFADSSFKGNPAAVCLLEGPVEESFMSKVAGEMNLSETAFLWPEQEGYRLRWFTPAVEVNLCGHATLASAHVLWESGRLGMEEEARFYTRSGLLTARRSEDMISLYFPPYELVPTSSIPGLAAALGIGEENIGVNEDPVTGSAHTALAPYWAGRLNRSRLTAYQASKRGGTLQLEINEGLVTISGPAVTVVSGQFHPAP